MKAELELKEFIKDVRELKVQGQTNIARSSLKKLGEIIKKYQTYKVEWLDDLRKMRPNEYILFNLLDELEGETEKNAILEKIEELLERMDLAEKKTIENGAKYISQYDTVLTHCHSEIVEKTLLEVGRKIRIFNTETRPRYQGRITATKLAQKGLKIHHLVDGAAKRAIEEYNIDLFVTGCDGIFPNGDIINKIGTGIINLAIKKNNGEHIVLTESAKFTTNQIKEFYIEERPPKEVWEVPKHIEANIEIIDPSFEVVKGRDIDFIISELGILSPSLFSFLKMEEYQKKRKKFQKSQKER